MRRSIYQTKWMGMNGMKSWSLQLPRHVKAAYSVTHPCHSVIARSSLNITSRSNNFLALLLAGGLGFGGFLIGTRWAVRGPETPPPAKPVYATKRELEKVVVDLTKALGEDAVSTDEEDLKAHGYSEWSSINIDQLPIVVVYPKNTDEVSRIAKIATKYRCPMVPYSGGSSLEGNFAAPFGGICIDFAFMNGTLAVHAEDMDVVVQPSVQWMALNESIKHTGLFFPVDPGPSAKIGGMVGTGCSGTNAFRYGTMKDYVVNLTVVLADGRVIKTRHRPRKSSAGYNLNGIFVGAEGTLGIVTEITLRLVAIPEATKVGVVTFETVRDAAATSQQIIRSGVPVAAMELLDDVAMMVVNKAGGQLRKWPEKPTLFFKFAGSPTGIEDHTKAVGRIAKDNKGSNISFAKDEKESQDIWKARKDHFWSMLAMRAEGDEVWTTDVAVPVSKIPDIVDISKEEVAKLGLFSTILGHLGDGNFHAAITYNRQDPEACKRVETVVKNMNTRAIEMEGTCTGEHGIGLGKKRSLVKELGPETIDVMRSLKRSLDPLWIMNPGKVFDAFAIEELEDEHTATAASALERPNHK